MYNLFVSSDVTAWNGQPWVQELGRCLREFTATSLMERFGDFTPDQVRQLQGLPCLFAYEAMHTQAPRFGRIRSVEQSFGSVRVQYDIQPVTPFLTTAQLPSLLSELAASAWEFNRTHWALKEVDLFRTLGRHGITLPQWARTASGRVDISTHQFDVALSFPGAVRTYVEDVAGILEQRLGPDHCFYDNNYQAQLAQPNLDVLLHGIYRERSKLIVAFIGAAYQLRNWCGLELRAIRDIILNRGHNRIMYVRLDDGEVEGIQSTDGYINAQGRTSAEIADYIEQRLAIFGS